MIVVLQDFYAFMERAASVGDIIKGLAGFFSISVFYVFVRDWFPKKVDLSIGSFVVKRKYYNVQNVTNIVSARYFDGGKVSDEVRKEIIIQTSPKIRNFTKKI